MTPTVNEFKRRLLAGERQLGLFATMADPSLVELLAARGFDWIVIDTEHAPTDVLGVTDRLRVLEATRTEAVVRPAWNDPILVKRLLDVGVRTLLFPSIGTPEAAALAVASTRYPPDGIRGVSGITRAAGYGRTRGYLRAAADGLCVIVQVETEEGLRNLDAIAAVPGVDAVFIGPSDLAASMGRLGDAGHPDVQAAVDGAFARLAELGVPAGYLTLRLDEARERAARGDLAFIGVASDTSIVQLGVDTLLDRLGVSLEEGPAS